MALSWLELVLLCVLRVSQPTLVSGLHAVHVLGAIEAHWSVACVTWEIAQFADAKWLASEMLRISSPKRRPQPAASAHCLSRLPTCQSCLCRSRRTLACVWSQPLTIWVDPLTTKPSTRMSKLPPPRSFLLKSVIHPTQSIAFAQFFLRRHSVEDTPVSELLVLSTAGFLQKAFGACVFPCLCELFGCCGSLYLWVCVVVAPASGRCLNPVCSWHSPRWYSACQDGPCQTACSMDSFLMSAPVTTQKNMKKHGRTGQEKKY